MPPVRFAARSITLPLAVVGCPAYLGHNALAGAIAAARKALKAQG